MNYNLLKSEIIPMSLKGIYIFKSDSGITLYSKKKVDVQEDLFSAFLSALKGFFSSFALGGLSSFASENFIFYIATSNNVLTALIVDSNAKSDKYFNLAYDISVKFYNTYKSLVDSKVGINIPDKEQFDILLDEMVSSFESSEPVQLDLIHLYKVTNAGDLVSFSFSNEEQLYNEELFITVNLVTKKIFIVENSEQGVPSRKLFLANKSASKLNQDEHKSEFEVRNVSDPWDFERIIDMISKLIRKESIVF